MATSAHQETGVTRWQRTLLPGDLVEGRPAPRSPRDWAVDALLAIAAAGIGLIALSETESQHSEPGLALDLVLGVAAWLALWARRSRPTAVAVGTLLASIVSATAAGPALLAAFSAAARAPRRGVVATAAVAVVAAAVFPLIYPTAAGYGTDLVLGESLTAVAIGWGLFVRARRQLVYSLRERAERLETEQRLKLAQAREAERRRIAGEMHDVLAHRVSLLSVHAGALEFRPDAPPEEIAEAAGVIRASAHSVLQELREVIGVLREGGTEDDLAPPQPTLADVPALVAEARAAGAHAGYELDLPGDAEPPPVLGRTAYRVVQEGLTNARKHAPAAAVEVAVAGRPGNALTVSVVSRRAVGGAEARVPGWGTGLVGLRERVTLAGGELEHGPDASGDFVLKATLPW